MGELSKDTEKYLRLWDIILSNEEYLSNYLPRLPLAYFRFKALAVTQNSIGYVRIVKSDDSKINLHPELGNHFGIPELANAWSAANTDIDRKAALNIHLKHTPDHEARASRFLSELISDRLRDALHVQPCCGCLCPLRPPLRISRYNTVRFCGDCAPYLSSGLVDIDLLDRVWLGIIPAWEDERTGEHQRILRAEPLKTFLDPQKVDELAQKIHWTTMPGLSKLTTGWDIQMRQDYCRYELTRLKDMVDRKWPDEHVAYASSWRKFPLDLYGIQFGPREEIQQRLSRIVWATEGTKGLSHAALYPDSPESRKLLSSADVRTMFGIDAWPLHDIDWMNEPEHRLNKMCVYERARRMPDAEQVMEQRFAEMIDDEFQKPGKLSDYYGVWATFAQPLRSAIRKEFFCIYDQCSTEPWREFIHLVQNHDKPWNSSALSFHEDVIGDDFAMWFMENRNRILWREFGDLFSTLPREMALSVHLMREAEALWSAYMVEEPFTKMSLRFFRTHSVVLLTKQDPDTAIVPAWARDMRRTHSISAFDILHGRHPTLNLGWKTSKGGQLAWLCLGEDCYCDSTI